MPDELWELFQLVVPDAPMPPQDGGRPRYGDREVLAAIVFVVTSRCTWAQLPPCFGPSGPTADRRFTEWSKAPGVGQAPPRRPRRTQLVGRAGLVVLRGRLGEHEGPRKGGADRSESCRSGKYGPKIHLLTEHTGSPLSVGISRANVHDGQALIPLADGIPPISSRRGPRRRRPGKLHGDKAYDHCFIRSYLRRRQTPARIGRRRVDSSARLARHRWVIERTVSGLNGFRRLHRRHERKADHFAAFAGIAAAPICHRRLAKGEVVRSCQH